MTLKEKYEKDVRDKNCTACALGDNENGACGCIGNCGATHSMFQPMELSAYESITKSHGAKYDDGKLEIDLVPPQIIRDIAEVRMYGTKKYGDPNNWRDGIEPRRYANALLRHTLAFMEDIHSVDEESGIPHYKHMACNLAFLCQMIAEGKDGK
ncbi:MAG: hypothetical protein IKL99_03965 [Oscillospiraceae bacterium]|nr:hypothetical protein [Oscillospiraceae bacterium]